jgi:hypothetical protein
MEKIESRWINEIIKLCLVFSTDKDDKDGHTYAERAGKLASKLIKEGRSRERREIHTALRTMRADPKTNTALWCNAWNAAMRAMGTFLDER